MSREYLDSPAGQLAMYRKRWFRRFFTEIKGIEPRSKRAMSEADKQAFQFAVANDMTNHGRRTFRELVALELRVATADPNPPHLHTIAKNLLDLLGRPLLPIRGFRSGLLYRDDSQVKILSVSASHGNVVPEVWMRAASLSAFVEDLTLAGEGESQSPEVREALARDEDPVSRLAESLRRKRELEGYFGSQGLDAVLFIERYEAQQYLLRNSFSLWQLQHLLGNRAPLASHFPHLFRSLAQDIANRALSSRVRLTLGELPARSGDSEPYRAAIDQAISNFRKKFGWIIQPLLVPIAIEAVIKPAPIARRTNMNDLDNVARNFLIPAVVEQLRPPSDLGWVADVQREAGTNVHAAAYWEERSDRLPRSTRIGVTRYDILELPRDDLDDGAGFVSVSLVADPIGLGSLFGRVDAAIEGWKTRINDGP